MTDDREFDRTIEEELTQLPLPEGEAEEITPWGRAMGRIVWGIGLTTLTLNFWYLNYLLPAVGVVLLWLGFRTLRRESRWFTACWIISLYNLASKFMELVGNATLWRPPEELPVWTGLTLAVPLIQFWCLWQGVRAVRRKAGQPGEAGAVVGLMVWYATLCFLAVSGVQGWLLVLPILIAYVCILRNLSKLPGLLDQAGYGVRAAPVWASDRTVWIAWAAALAVCVPLAALLFGRYPMIWTPVVDNEQAGQGETREHLLDLGFPEWVLDDLTPGDLSACCGATRVVWETEENPVNDGRAVSTTVGNHTTVRTVYDVYELRLTNVAVELPNNSWKIIHHFLWQGSPGARGTESLQFWFGGITPESYRVSREAYSLSMTGRLLYDWKGAVYQGDYYRLGEETYVSDSIFWGSQTNRDIFAEFSLPLRGENCRGYVSFNAGRMDGDRIFFDSWMNYTHQRGWLNYPAVTAKEYRQGHMFSNGRFITIQSQIIAGPEERN